MGMAMRPGSGSSTRYAGLYRDAGVSVFPWRGNCPGSSYIFGRNVVLLRFKIKHMRHLWVLFLLTAMYVRAQEARELKVQHAIERFFEGFHEQDSLKMKSTVGKGVVLQTIVKKNDGRNEVQTESFAQFLKAIVRIPDSVAFREVIRGFDIRVDGPMAHAWTPYEFWLNDTFSHCGVNSFQLIEQKDGWKIIYLIDTRRKEDCP